MLLNRTSMMTLVLLTLGSSIVVAQPNILLAQPAPPSPTPTKTINPNAVFPGGLPKELNLTTQQLDQIRGIRRKNPYKEPIQRKREAMLKLRQEFLTLMAGTATTQEVRKKYREINAVKEQIANAEYEDDLEIRDILTLEQRKKWVEYIQRRSTPNSPSQPK